MNDTANPPEVSISREGSSATIWICHPPLNLLVQSVRAGLARCLTTALHDSGVDRIVLRSSISCFAAGADIGELRETIGQIPPLSDPELTPTLRSLVAMIRMSNKHTVAIIEGFALGGGFELALACDTRFAHTDARLGLPEVKLGLLPGSGGTQMLTRLAGTLTALDLCANGRHVSSSEALHLGLIDAVFEDEATLERLNGQSNKELGPRRRSWRALKEEINEEWFSTARLRAAQCDPGFLAPLNVIKSIKAATNSVEQGLAVEWGLWLELFWHSQRRGRFHEFFASRDLGRVAPGEKVADISLLLDHSAGDRLGVTDVSVGTSTDVILVTADAESIPQAEARPWLRIVDSLEAAPWSGETGQIVFRRGTPARAIVEIVVNDAKEMPIALGASKCFRRFGFPAFASKIPRVSVLDTLIAGFELAKTEIKQTAPTLDIDVELTRFGFVTPAQMLEVAPVDPTAASWASNPVIGPVVRRLDSIAKRLMELGAVLTTEITDVAAVYALGFPAHAGGPSFALERWKENAS